jgi:hypothetical protein
VKRAERYRIRDNGGRENQCAYMDQHAVDMQTCRVGAQGPTFVQPIAVQNSPAGCSHDPRYWGGLECFCQVVFSRPRSLWRGPQTGVSLTSGGTSTKHLHTNLLSGWGSIDIGHVVCACGGLHGTTATCIIISHLPSFAGP